MSIVSVEKTWSQRSAEKDRIRDVWVVVTTGALDDTQVAARDADGLPAYGQPHEHDPALQLVNRSAEPLGRNLWRVVCEFARKDLASEARTNDTAGGWVLSYGTAAAGEAIDQDVDGKAIVNSAEETLDPPISIDFFMPRISAVKEFPDWIGRPDEGTLEGLVGHVNQADFLGRRAGSVLFKDYAIEPYQGPNGERWHRCRLEFVVRRVNDPVDDSIVDWKERRLDAGFRRKRSVGAGDASGDGYAAITDAHGTPVGRPVPLAVTGQPLAAGETPHWLKFEVRPKGDFSKFHIRTPDRPVGLGN